ncbi:MAG: amino acid adenylation domain-containing protein [Kiritimatiellales bacterium]|nr:amino acid adenylation domain-containing protein [Kiritimatiellales bacterium]
MKTLLPHPDTSPKHATVIDWLHVGSAYAPEHPAACFGSNVVSHFELNARGNRIAHYLIRHSVKRGDRVGMCLDRSIEMVAALVGILKAGAAYVPLDPSYPRDRLAMMQEDAGLRCVLTHSAHADLFEHGAGSLLVWEKIEGDIAAEPSSPADIAIDPEDIAYVIFTSGSTGRPKGISMPHRALANLVEWQLERKTFKPGARVLQYSSISFDVSFQEIATTIASGGTLYLVSNDDRKDPRKLLAQLVDQKIERLFLPYVAMRSIIEAAHMIGIYPVDLKETITAGEQLRVDDAVRDYFQRIDSASLDNQYGPSETHVITAHLLEDDPSGWPDLPSIGTALKNCGTIILDENMQPVPDGEEGELYLAGRNLAHGYIGRDDLTKQVFIPSPFDVPERPILYKSGDLARYHADGSIDFLGRRDHQIKVLGHRIEPGDINNTASQLPGIGQCLTHAFRGSDGGLKLAAYYTVKEGAAVSFAELRRHLDAKLPDYMVPAFLIQIDSIPYTPSGKVDLKSLPKPSIENSQYAGEEVRYESKTEETLSSIWSELLGLDGIPRSADFFELGGDSLRAVTLFLKIQQRFGQDLPLATLTHASILADLARLIDGESDAPDLSGYRSLKMIQPGDEGIVPLFLVHGGQGNVLVFNNFAKSLGARQPVYAFQWSGWDGYRGASDIRSMARAYRDELLRFLPEGPLRLGGYCIGGLIAIELVRLLEETGRSIAAPLVVWDSPNLESIHYRKDEPWDSAKTIEAFNMMKAGLEAIRMETTVDPVNVPQSDYSPPAGKAALIRSVPGLVSLLRAAKAFKLYLPTVPTRVRIAAMLAVGTPLPIELRSQYCLWMMVKAVERHRSSKHAGDVLYFRSDCVVGRYFGLRGWWDDPFLGFAEVCVGRFEAHAIGGGHTDVLDIPEMSEIVKRTFQCVE